MLLVAVDVGGTHTDLYARWDGGATSAKVPSTPGDPTEGVVDALEHAGIDLASVEYFLHGSTITTNALIEGSYPDTALLTTEGFRDVIEIGRYHREALYDPYQTKPDPLVPRRRRITVPERIGADGEVTEPLDEGAVREAARGLPASVEAVAVGFVNAYVNPDHERRAAGIVREETDCYVARSSAVAPTLGTLDRFSTTVVNAALSPMTVDYLDRLGAALEERGFEGRFSVVKSNGGVMGAEAAAGRAETTILSGPAAGARGAGFVGDAIGEPSVIGMDMGGTSTDVSLVEDGEPLVTTEYEVRFDVPVAVPMVDVNTIGSGGGTIAWIDDGGSLRVGPRSAGADPGPACYPGGGDAPTITDANLLLGRLNPENFLGGEVRLSEARAREAIVGVAERVGLEPLEAASGILEIANENMAAAIREATIERGRDPRDYHLVGFGGCGPMHAPAVARSLGVPTVVVPADPGVLSAFAATMMDAQHDAGTSFHAPADGVDIEALNDALRDLDATALDLVGEGFDPADVRVDRTAEMRYVGQTYELDVPLPDGRLSRADVESVIEAFHGIHEAEYGIANREFAVEFVDLRARSTARFAGTSMPRAEAGDGHDPDAREVRFDGAWHEAAVYDRAALAPGSELSTPAVVEDPTATTVVEPGMDARVDEYGNVVVDTGVGA